MLPSRVFQVATGNVGTEMIKRIADRTGPGTRWGALLFTREDRTRRRRAGRYRPRSGSPPPAPSRRSSRPNPDVLTFHGVFPDEDLYVKVLEAGINIVTTADWITGWHRDKNHPHPSGKPVSQLLSRGLRQRGSTFYGTGMNPGLNQILGIVCSADVAEIENVPTLESVDVSCHHSKETWIEVGYGRRSTIPASRQAGEVHPRSSPTAC